MVVVRRVVVEPVYGAAVVVVLVWVLVCAPGTLASTCAVQLLRAKVPMSVAISVMVVFMLVLC